MAALKTENIKFWTDSLHLFCALECLHVKVSSASSIFIEDVSLQIMIQHLCDNPN